MIHWKIFLIAVITNLSVQLNPWLYPKPVKESCTLCEAISAIIRSNPSYESFVINFIYSDTEPVFFQKHQEIRTNILQNISELTTHHITFLQNIQHDESAGINIFLVATINSLMEVTSLMKSRTINTYGYNIFALTEKINKAQNLFTAVSDELFELSTIKVVFLYSRPINMEIVDMYSFLPFSSKNCHSAELVLLNYFQDGKFQLNSLRLDGELHNFHGCPLDTLLMPYSPYMIEMGSSKIEDMDGIDILILRILMEHLNFTLRYNISGDFRERGDIFLNRTATGIMKMIMDGKLHFLMGGVLWTKARNMYLSPSISYDSFELYLGVPMGTPYIGFELLFMPFRYDVWIVCSLIFMFSLIAPTLCSIGIQRLTKHSGEKIFFASAFTMTSAWFESPLSKIPRQNSLRFLLNLVLFGLMILRVVYKGGLYDHLQANRLKIPNSIQEYVDEGFDVITVPFFQPILTKIGVPEKQQRKMSEQNIYEDIFRLADDPTARHIVIQAKRIIDFFNSANWSRNLLQAYPERVFNVPISIFFTKNSYLKATFDRELLNMMSCGITENIFKRFNNRSAVDKPKVFQKYTIDHLGGCFQLYCFMMGVSFVCFLCEVIAGRYWKNQKYPLNLAE